jgi:hypothetical protein
VSHWGGFGAVVLTNSQDGVTVIGQDNAQLFCSRRARGEGWIFATRPEDLVDVAKEAGISLATCPIKVPTRLMFFDRTGIMFHDEEWLGFGTNTGQTYNRQYDRAYGTETGHANGNGNGKGEAGFFAGGASGASQPPTPRSDSDSPKADSAQGNCESSKVGCERTPNSSGLITTGAQPSDYRPKATTAQVLGVNHTPPTAEETLEAQVREHFGYID